MKYLAACAIVRNEAPYIEEWIRYHTYIGVEEFYIYENYSSDLTYPILQKLAMCYPIKLYRIRGLAMQFKAYEMCLLTHGKDARWIAFIDIDEFLVPKNTNDVQAFLQKYEAHPGLCVHWYFFGSNGRTVYTPEPVLERFTKREREVNPHTKNIVDPSKTFSVKNPHRFEMSSPPVDENFRPVVEPNGYYLGGTCNILQINHYGVKSLEECTERRSRPRADIGKAYPAMPGYFVERDLNQVEDFTARNIWQALC